MEDRRLTLRPATLEDRPRIDQLVVDAFQREHRERLLYTPEQLSCANDAPSVLRFVVEMPPTSPDGPRELAATWSAQYLYNATELFEYLGGDVQTDPSESPFAPAFPLLVGGRAAASRSTTTRHAKAFVALFHYTLTQAMLASRLFSSEVALLNVHGGRTPEEEARISGGGTPQKTVVDTLCAHGYRSWPVIRMKPTVFSGPQVITYASKNEIEVALGKLTEQGADSLYDWESPHSMAELLRMAHPVVANP